jgi:O-antigen/teichoic acid export membrane protein
MASTSTTNLASERSSPEQTSTAVAHETVLAFRNAAILLASLVGTLGVSVAVRIWLPRFLGPDTFGRLHFSEEFSAAAMYFTTLGVETYIKREIATRPRHASDFFGGLVLVRLLVTLAVYLAMAGTLYLMGIPRSDWHLVYAFGLGQVAFVFNTSIASCLQAVGNVRAIAVTNVVSKVLWGFAIVGGLALGGGIIVVPLSFAVTEGLKAPVLFAAARKHLDLRLKFSVSPVLAVIAFSFPYYINQLAHEVYARIGVGTMSSMAEHAEVGWYGAANQVKTLILLVLPILNAVVLPMSSRVARNSTAAMNEVMNATVRLAFMIAVPMAALIALNARLVMLALFSREYAPAAAILQVLTAVIPLSCYCVISSMHLLQLGRIWTVTVISFVGLAFSATANPILIRLGHNHLQHGGAGMAAAAVAVLTELLVALLMYAALGAARTDKRLAPLLAKLAVLCAALALLHLATAPLGHFRLFLEASVYVALGTLWKVIPLRDIALFVRNAYQRRP